MNPQMYARVLERDRQIVANTRPDQLDDPTPCADWSVRDLLNHMIGGMKGFASGARGVESTEPRDTDHVGDDHVAAFEAAADDAIAAFTAPGAMEGTHRLPWGESPASISLALAIADAAVHGWDLAKATGQPATIDEDVATAIYGMTTSMMEPLGSMPRRDAFAPPVEVPEDAPVADKALAYMGRKP